MIQVKLKFGAGSNYDGERSSAALIRIPKMASLFALLLSKETRSRNLETMEEEAATAAIEATSP